MPLKPWYKVVTPREDLREGKPLDASEFAVHLDQVREGRAPADYQKPERFFERTYLTKNLSSLASEVIRRLSGERTETNAIFNLATQFGGGKTHALTLLYHLARSGPAANKWAGVATLLAKAGVAGVPKAEAAVFVGTEFDSITGRGGNDGTPLRKTPWGEIAFQLGGEAAFAVVAEHDKKGEAPGGDVSISSRADFRLRAEMAGEYKPFCFNQALMTGDVELSDELFIVTKETAETYLKGRATSPPPSPVTPPPEQPGKPVTPGEPPAVPPPAPAAPTSVAGLTWSGDVPPQKWMNFHTNPLSAPSGLSIFLEEKIKLPGQPIPSNTLAVSEPLPFCLFNGFLHTLAIGRFAIVPTESKLIGDNPGPARHHRACPGSEHRR